MFCHTHCDLPLDYRLFSYPELTSFAASKSKSCLLTPQQFRVFLPILEKLSYALDNSLLHAEEEAKFSEVALVFVNHCVEFIRKHRCLFLPKLKCLASKSCPNTCALFLPKYNIVWPLQLPILRHFVASDPEYLVQLEHILKCLHILESSLRKCNSQVRKVL